MHVCFPLSTYVSMVLQITFGHFLNCSTMNILGHTFWECPVHCRICFMSASTLSIIAMSPKAMRIRQLPVFAYVHCKGLSLLTKIQHWLRLALPCPVENFLLYNIPLLISPVNMHPSRIS